MSDRNAILSTTHVSAMHWPTAQATSLEKITFRLTDAKKFPHQELLIEDGELSSSWIENHGQQ